jgi:hypothetical protein
MILLLALAHANPPNRVAATFGTDSASIASLTTSDDGRYVVASHNDGVLVLDTESWTTASWDGCGAGGAAARENDDGTYTVYAVCTSGAVHQLAVGATALTDDPTNTWSITTNQVHGAFWDVAAERLYVLATDTSGAAPRVHRLDPATDTVDGTGYPVQLPRQGFVDAVLTTTRLLVLHGGDDISSMTLGATVAGTNTLPSAYNISDLAPSVRSTAYGADQNGLITEFQPGSSTWTLLVTGTERAEAVGASHHTGDEWLLVARAARVDAYALTNGVPSGSTPTSTFTVEDTLQDIVVGPEGYAIANSGAGNLVVLTSNPWISDAALDVDVASSGDEVALSFDVDVDVAWSARLGGSTGPVLVSGEAEAGVIDDVFLVDTRFEEGENRVVIVATDDAGNTGTAGVVLTLDDAPDAIALSEDALGFSNGALTLSFAGLPDADLARYEVYVSTVEFDPDVYPTGGPDFEGDDAIVNPIEVVAEPGAAVEARIEPLTNGVTYYVAVRAIDDGGKEGPMSNVVSGTPRRAFSATERNGDEGGPACATVSAIGVGAPWLVAALALRRARRRVAGPALAGAVALGVASDARAELPTDATPAWWSLQVAYGSARLTDETLRETYGTNGHDTLQFDFGPQFYRFAEVNLGIGYYRDVASTTDANGEASGDEARFTVVPLSLDARLRLHILDEQPVVPYFRVGVDYALWQERWQLDAESFDKTSGAKAGWHYGLGGALLLDSFAPGRASLLEANSGINDTWLFVEWRKQTIEPGKFLMFENSQGTKFSGTQLLIGLELDY